MKKHKIFIIVLWLLVGFNNLFIGDINLFDYICMWIAFMCHLVSEAIKEES